VERRSIDCSEVELTELRQADVSAPGRRPYSPGRRQRCLERCRASFNEHDLQATFWKIPDRASIVLYLETPSDESSLMWITSRSDVSRTRWRREHH
jgi:hypothetical protein